MAIFCSLLLLFSNITFASPVNFSMYSESYSLMDADTGRVLAGKEEDSPMANASTTKILTCIITLEVCNLDEMVTISENAAFQPRVRLGMKEGERYPLKDLLYGLMLESYNDCAVAIAEHVAGSVEKFAEQMNCKAKEIGCKDTYFITPNGLDAEDDVSFHHTTATDLCRLMAYCTWESPQKNEFLNITQKRNYTGTSNGKEYSFMNHNSLLDQMEGVVSGKTGFTNKAGYCYVAALEKDNERYCIALLACGWPNNKNYKWSDARKLFEYGLENYDKYKIVVKRIEDGLKINGVVGKNEFNKINQIDKLKIKAPNLEHSLLMQSDEEIDTVIEIYDNINLPIRKGQQLGECNLYISGKQIGSVPLLASENVYIWGLKEVISTIFYQFLTFSL